MPKRNQSSSTPLHERRSPRLRLVPPTTYYGSGSQQDPIVVGETEHTGDTVVDGGLNAPVAAPVEFTTPTQADLDELCIIIADEVPSPSPIRRRPFYLRGAVRRFLDEARRTVDSWPDDGEFINDWTVPHQIVMAASIARDAVRQPTLSPVLSASEAEAVRQESIVRINCVASALGRSREHELRRIPSDLTSLTLRSQDSTRSGGTEEYKRAELEDTDDEVV